MQIPSLVVTQTGLEASSSPESFTSTILIKDRNTALIKAPSYLLPGDVDGNSYADFTATSVEDYTSFLPTGTAIAFDMLYVWFGGQTIY
ncbi:MAG: hypothetical protein U0930_11195 [Pirellulales bacterium]